MLRTLPQPLFALPALLAAFGFLVLGAVSPAHAQHVFVVDDPGDAIDATAGDGVCATAAGVCTLRAAIGEANATANVDASTPDSIAFAISTTATINAGSGYAITDPLVIDGTTASSGTLPRLRIDGGTGDGFLISAGGSTLRGLQIVRFNGHGVVLTGGGGNVVEDSQIGDFMAAGTPAGYGNGGHGIHITGGSTENRIGGTEAGAGNVISGNGGNGITITGGATPGANNVVSGNYIGVAADGVADLGNTGHGVLLEAHTRHNKIGQSLPDAPGNVISGNGLSGVQIVGTFGNAASSNTSGNEVYNNRIGVDDAGTTAVPNDEHGVNVEGATGTAIGTFLPLPNVISGNGQYGVSIFGTDVTVRGNLIGTDVSGTTRIGNGDVHAGVILTGATSGTSIGGTVTAWRNVISGNERGIELYAATGNTIAGNYIGTDKTGSAALPNDFEGITLTNSSQNTIGGTADGARNVVSGNGGDGIVISGTSSTNNTITGNYVGVGADGTTELGNDHGIFLEDASQNVIGGSAAGASNVVAGNINGIFLLSADENTILGNYIGTNADGEVGIGNYDGIVVNGSLDNVIGGTGAGEANVIAYNTSVSGQGVNVASGTGNSIRGNAMYANSDLGIDLGTLGVTPNDAGDADSGTNNLQNFPEIVEATYNPFVSNSVTATYRVPSDPSLTGSGASAYPLTIDFYLTAADREEGAVYLGTSTYSASAYMNGPEVWASLTPADSIEITQNDFLVATATDADGNTSEFSAAISLGPALFIVDDTGDAADFDVADDVCDTDDSAGDGPCTLRAALEQANATPNANSGTLFAVPDSIIFDLAGTATPAAPHVIQPAAELPRITDPVIVDGTSEPDYSGSPAVMLDGQNATGTANEESGLYLQSDGSTVRGLSIVRFDRDGIALTGNGNTVEASYIGVEPDGTTAAGNGGGIYSGQGITVIGSDNTIGGADTDARNVISANDENGVFLAGSNNTVANNYVGTDAAASAALPNFRGIEITATSDANTIAGNVISGNGQGGGISMHGTNNVLQGNRIGVNADGDALSNEGRGVFLTAGAADNTLGGTAAAEGNVIAHNTNGGVIFNSGSSAAGNGNAVRGNAVYANTGTFNAGLGIDLGEDGPTANDPGDADSGPNRLQNYPEIQRSVFDGSEITVSFQVNTDPAHAAYPLAIDFYEAGSGGEGAVYLGTTTYTEDDFNGVGDAACSTGPCPVTATFTPLAAVTTSDYIVATATDAADNTSEFALPQGPLPVELTGLEAVRDGEVVRLAWQTASETSNDHFAVQRSAREGAWTTLGHVEGAGTTSEAQSYSFVDEDVPFEAETLRYRLRQTDTDGTTHLSEEVEVAAAVPEAFALHGSFPNPFAQATTIRYELPEAAHVTLHVYDALGRRVRTLVDARQEAGRHALRFDGADLPSGLYLYRMQAGEHTQTRRLTIVR